MDLIAVVDQNWAIGCGGGLLCHLSADLRRFKALTMGHPILLGRKTLASFPAGRPLPGRRNIILSRTMEEPPEGAEVVRSVEEALDLCPSDTFVVGGEQVYRALLDRCRRAYITKIDAAFPADAWLPDLDALPEWHIIAEEPPRREGEISFRYVTYERMS